MALDSPMWMTTRRLFPFSQRSRVAAGSVCMLDCGSWLQEPWQPHTACDCWQANMADTTLSSHSSSSSCALRWNSWWEGARGGLKLSASLLRC